MENEKRFSVSRLSALLKECFKNPAFKGITVYGEVYSIGGSTYIYIDIGDQGQKQAKSPVLRCAFRPYYGSGYGLENIKEGDIVEIHGNLTYYEHGSGVTLWGDSIKKLEDQTGKSLLEKKEILERLDKLGYLDEKRKKKLPKYVQKVALITSNNSAAYNDMIKTLHDRFPVSTVLYPAIVQGENAAASLSRQLKRAIASDCDCIIIGRGGGSKSDLSCFDDEKLAMMIAESPKVTITCIGHQIDTSIADRVSDYHAITPTEGASLINPSLKDTYETLAESEKNLKEELVSQIDQNVFALDTYEKRLEALSPLSRLASSRTALVNKEQILNSRFRTVLDKKASQINTESYDLKIKFNKAVSAKKENISSYENALEKLDTTKISKLGYAKITKNGAGIRSYKDLSKGDEVTISFEDGHKEAVIKE